MSATIGKKLLEQNGELQDRYQTLSHELHSVQEVCTLPRPRSGAHLLHAPCAPALVWLWRRRAARSPDPCAPGSRAGVPSRLAEPRAAEPRPPHPDFQRRQERGESARLALWPPAPSEVSAGTPMHQGRESVHTACSVFSHRSHIRAPCVARPERHRTSTKTLRRKTRRCARSWTRHAATRRRRSASSTRSARPSSMW